jgi:K+-transporting ATPase KdpF subunit
MYASILTISVPPNELDTSLGYVFGIIIALFILVYLIYSLIKPEKF